MRRAADPRRARPRALGHALLVALVAGCTSEPPTGPSDEDGLEIVYSYREVGATTSDLRLMSSDGLEVRPFVSLPGVEVSPEWSRDGRSVAFHHYAPTAPSGPPSIVIAEADGSGVRTLVASENSYNPRWSPDGQWLAFESRIDQTYGIAIIRADGTSRRWLAGTTNNSSIGPLSWSVDDRIAFVRPDGIWSVRSDGTALTRITASNADSDPRWSPDGARLLYTRTYELAPFEYRNELRVANADGSNTRILLAGEILQTPTWSPDGQWILYSRFDLTSGSNQRCVFEKIPAAGGAPVTLTPTFGQGICAGVSWRARRVQ